jgi:uncharacterized protein (DUF1015 family)
MARVRPFAALRYASADTDITSLTAPPYDVVSESQRAEFLERNPRNVVALELPEGHTDAAAPGNRYEVAASTWDAWRQNGTVIADPRPSVYVLEQRFVHDGHRVRRRALIVEVGLEQLDSGIILPHERTLPKALGDRRALIGATGANFSQVFGLFDDAAGETDVIFDMATVGEPISSAVDSDEVTSLLWAVSDPLVVESIVRLFSDKRIFIADGHHRYTTALAYRDARRAAAATAGALDPDPAYEYVMMALVNMEDPELVVMPTHRVADAPGAFDADAFYAALATNFIVEDLAAGHPSNALDGLARPAFLVKVRGDDRLRRVRLRDDADLDTLIELPLSDAWKHLDVAVLQELILAPLLDIHPDRPETLDRLWFVKDAHETFRQVGEHDVAFVLRPTRMDQLRAVATAGETMPQKSTYFYPKLLSGMVFRSAE